MAYKKENLITLKQACEILKCHPNTLRNWDREGKLKAVRIGSRQDRFYDKKSVLRILDEQHENTGGFSSIQIPLLGLASCGAPEFFADENIEDFIPVDQGLVRGERNNYYLLRTTGSSMDKIIPEKSLVLVERRESYDEGDDVVVAIDGLATIKRMYKGNSALLFMPMSSDDQHKPIVTKENFYIAGKVVCAVPDPNNLESIRYVDDSGKEISIV